jgi:hypothetical protein
LIHKRFPDRAGGGCMALLYVGAGAAGSKGQVIARKLACGKGNLRRREVWHA